jgi:hypothetical protein
VLLHTIDEHAADKHTTLEMWWNGSHLITAVQDGDRDIEPHYAPRGPLSQIAALSDGWGCCAATATGGKIIWFSRRAPAAERAPLAATAPSPTLWESCRIPRALREPAYATATETQGGGS